MNIEVTEGFRRIVLILLAVLLAIGLGTGANAWREGHPPFGPTEDQWHGVFLTNGQAYFGHFYSGPGEFAKLREVYYVLATQLQPQDPRVPVQTQLSLQRLGGEIHGPKQDMEISKQQILFVEELRPDSAVVATIKQLKQGVVPAPQQPQQPQQTVVPAPATTAPPPATSAPAATRSPSPSPTR